MKKKTKKAIGIGVASAAAFAAGMLLYAAPAYADEACGCEPGNHTQDCTCGCADAAKVLEDAEHNKQAAQTEADSAVGAEKIAKDAAEDASAAAKTAETAKDEAETAYKDALAKEDAAIKADQEKKAEAEAAASDALNQAVVKEGQAELAADEAKTASDAAKEELDTAIGYRDGTLPIEDTEEYKTAQEKQAALDTAKADRDAAGDTLDAAKADAADKTNALDAASKDNDEKQKTLNDKQTKAEDAQTAADDAKTEHDADVTALNTATQEKEAADKDVADKTAGKEAADKAQTDASAAYESAKTATQDAKSAKEAADKAVEDYKKQNENSRAFFDWISHNQTVSASVKEDADNALAVLRGESGSYGYRNKQRATPEELVALADMGADGKTTALDNILDIVNYIKESNDLRKIEAQEKGIVIPELRISSELTAIAQMQLNYSYSDEVKGHASTYNVAENIAIGQNPTWDAQEDVAAFYVDEQTGETGSTGGPFSAWYSLEKYLFNHPELEQIVNAYEENSYETGHYENVIDDTYVATGFAIRQQDAGAIFGSDYAGHIYNVFGQTFSYKGGGISVDEYESLITAYKAKVDSEREALDASAKAAFEKLSAAESDEASKKVAEENAVKAAQDAATALTSAQNTQAEKAKALEDASSKEKASKDALTAAEAALAAAGQELADAKAAADTAADALETATKANAEAQAVLGAAQNDYDTKQTAYENALAEDEAADKALAELSNVAPRQEAYDKALALAGEAATALEQAKADTEAAQTVYDEAKRALEVANMRVAADAEAVKSAYEAFQSAEKDYADKSQIAASRQALYEASKEDTLKAQEALKAAQDRLAAAKLALEAAEKECESHMAKDVTVAINFKTKDGEILEKNDAAPKPGGVTEIPTIKRTGTKQTPSAVPVTTSVVGTTSGTKAINAAQTGDNNYAQIAGYTILAASALAGMAIAIVGKKRSNR